jgi:Ca-activated chloride channel homolog
VAAASDLPVSTITSGTPEVIVESNGRTLEVPVNGEPCANSLRRWGGTAYTAESGEQVRDVYADIGSSNGWRISSAR